MAENDSIDDAVGSVDPAAWSHTEGSDDDDDDDDDDDVDVEDAVPLSPLPQLLQTFAHPAAAPAPVPDDDEAVVVTGGRPRVCVCLALDRRAVAQSLLAIQAT